MTVSEIFKDAYPEQWMAATRDEIRRAEREQQLRHAAAQRRRERAAAARAHASRWWRSGVAVLTPAHASRNLAVMSTPTSRDRS